jgi:predicted regulator of Ras-like GTPase activity (Roadblock/LC7/MglB family)
VNDDQRWITGEVDTSSVTMTPAEFEALPEFRGALISESDALVITAEVEAKAERRLLAERDKVLENGRITFAENGTLEIEY